MFYDRKTQGPIRVSARTAAKLAKTDKDTGLSLCKEAVHHGFWRGHGAGHLGSSDKGVATSYILTDEMFRGKPATLDFLRWDGTPFHEQHTPAYYKRQERSLARLKALHNHKKTESRPVCPGHPVRNTQDTPVRSTQDTPPKIQQNPVRNTQDISRENLSISTASKPVRVHEAEPDPKIALNHGLQVMLDLLTGYFANKATRTEWVVEIQKRFTGRNRKLREDGQKLRLIAKSLNSKSWG